LKEPVEGLDDSKKLSPKRRLELACEIIVKSAVAISVVSPKTIDRINILNATMLGMRASIERLCAELPIAAALIDGNRIPGGLKVEARAIVKGDATIPQIMAASIVAKTVRDHIMIGYGESMPGYGFDIHKGYGTREHLKAISRLGATRIHRRSFKPCW
jgi:ribonuclease HII